MTKEGPTLGHYQVLHLLGKGGMGEVYRAKDLTLGREVAVKILPEEFATDHDRVARFQREAKVLASLNHQNIASIYGLEETAGTNFLVMELVEGETLAERIESGPMAVEESIKIALQIAEALEAAHENGIIHRDLKPANIKVTPEGKIKVLDFGLAKAFAADQADPKLSHSPTFSLTATQQGIILGTAAYMPPEQARGKVVDKRADIWAFGCVLYEMLAGRSPFSGKDVAEILAAVIRAEPDWIQLPSNLTPRLREVIERCLEKEPRSRYHDIGDVRVEIEKTLAAPRNLEVGSKAVGEQRPKWRLGLPWVATAMVLSAIVAGLAGWRLKPPDPKPVIRFSYIVPENQTLASGRCVAVSPDGRRFAYASVEGIYLRSLDQMESRLIPGTGNAEDPEFSPDGEWIAFRSGKSAEISKIAVGGMSPIKVCDATTYAHPSWGEDNTIVFDQGDRILRVSADGGKPETIVEEKGRTFRKSHILPDGKNLLFSYVTSLTGTVAVQSLVDGKRKELFPGDQARYLPTGHIVYVVNGSLYAVPFDAGKLEVTGGPVALEEGISRGANIPRFAVSRSGTLVYQPGAPDSLRTLVWVDRKGKEEEIDIPPRAFVYARLSPDGTRVALDIRDQENDIWIWDLARKTLARLTFDPGLNRGPVWSPDGRRLAFSAERNGAENVYWQAADGSGSPEPLTTIPHTAIFPYAFTPDGKQLVFGETAAPRDLSIVSLGEGAAPKRLLATSFDEQNAQISPDGHWIAYQSNESGVYQVYVRPFPNVDAGRWQISTEGGTRPLWNQNGREIFYYWPPGKMMAVPVETGSSFKAGTPVALFQGQYPTPNDGLQYSVTPDGQRFLMIKAAAAKPGGTAPPQQFNIVVNWSEELKRRVPGRK